MLMAMCHSVNVVSITSRRTGSAGGLGDSYKMALAGPMYQIPFSDA